MQLLSIFLNDKYYLIILIVSSLALIMQLITYIIFAINKNKFKKNFNKKIKISNNDEKYDWKKSFKLSIYNAISEVLAFGICVIILYIILPIFKFNLNNFNILNTDKFMTFVIILVIMMFMFLFAADIINTFIRGKNKLSINKKYMLGFSILPILIIGFLRKYILELNLKINYTSEVLEIIIFSLTALFFIYFISINIFIIIRYTLILTNLIYKKFKDQILIIKNIHKKIINASEMTSIYDYKYYYKIKDIVKNKFSKFKLLKLLCIFVLIFEIILYGIIRALEILVLAMTIIIYPLYLFYKLIKIINKYLLKYGYEAFAYNWLKWILIISLIITYYFLLKFNISGVIINVYQMIATVVIIPIVLNGLINLDKSFKEKTDRKDKQEETI